MNRLASRIIKLESRRPANGLEWLDYLTHSELHELCVFINADSLDREDTTDRMREDAERELAEAKLDLA
jgi:hypothetical protein